ncbi:hypothetical protein QFC20_003423 [Naganishia adeliensis]|uniref:Uncharacterized protein n=1 Tax=Naganishia adeliensis TaxID=92952 RepID=A0ACC2WA54_9TREE|nr:hypothetical protein QFC20_003423 [Naganishia adeliensis]
MSGPTIPSYLALTKSNESKGFIDDTSEDSAEAATARTLENASIPEDSPAASGSANLPSILVRYEKELQWDTKGGLFTCMWTCAPSGKYFEFDGLESAVKRITVQEGLGSRSYGVRVDEEWMIMARDGGDYTCKQSKDEQLKACWFEATGTCELSAFDLLVLATGMVATGGCPKGRTAPEEAGLDALLIAPVSEKNLAPSQQPIKAARLAEIRHHRWFGRREGRRLMKDLVSMLQTVKNHQSDVDAECLKIGDKLARVQVMFEQGFCYWRKYLDVSEA